MKYRLYIMLLAQLSILAACKDITEIQHTYVADRDGCIRQTRTSTNIYFDSYPSEATDKDKKNALNEVFCECMRDHGWRTARTLFDPYPECPKPPGETIPDAKKSNMLSILNQIYDTIVKRRSADPKSSYVAGLFAKGSKKIAQKLGEEATETVLASAGGDKNEIIYESADLLFHLMILWAAHGITPDDIAQELTRRQGTSGLEEKASRVKS